MKSLQSHVPILDWLPSYQCSWLRTDLMAGLKEKNERGLFLRIDRGWRRRFPAMLGQMKSK
jgi:hypothetical protein